MSGTIATFDTVETADCVEACPIEGLERSLVVATYQLHKAAATGLDHDTRCGSLTHFQLQHHSQESQDVSVQECERMATPSGVFDIKWSAQRLQNKAILAAATAGGTLEFYELHESDRVLKHSGVMAQVSDEAMCLSLDWNNRVLSNLQPSICVSQSNG